MMASAAAAKLAPRLRAYQYMTEQLTAAVIPVLQ